MTRTLKIFTEAEGDMPMFFVNRLTHVDLPKYTPASKSELTSKYDWDAKGNIRNTYHSSVLAGTIRAIFGSFHNLECTAKIHLRADKYGKLPHGTITAWTDESEELIRSGLKEVERILSEIHSLGLESYVLKIDVKIERPFGTPNRYTRPNPYDKPNRYA